MHTIQNYADEYKRLVFQALYLPRYLDVYLSIYKYSNKLPILKNNLRIKNLSFLDVFTWLNKNIKIIKQKDIRPSDFRTTRV